MPALHVRNVSEKTMLGLKERAARHSRSVQAEVRELLDAAAREPAEPAPARPLRLVLSDAPTTSNWSREEIYGDDGR